MNAELAARALERARKDLAFLEAPEGYLRAGWPRFYSYFTRDSCIAAWQMLRHAPRIARDTLIFSARSQGSKFSARNGEEPGKFCHQTYDRGERPLLRDSMLSRLFYGSRQYYAIDATPLWVILAHRWWKRDERAAPILRERDANVASALTWIRYRLRRDDFLVYRKQNLFAFSHQGWRDGFVDSVRIQGPVALVDVQAYAYAALRGGAELERAVFANFRAAEDLTNEAKKLRENFNARFWWSEEGTYAFALAGPKLEQVRRIVPDPGMCLFSGIVPEERAARVVNRLFRPDLWTPYGLRSLSVWNPLFRPDSYHNGSIWPWQNWLIWLGLMSAGYRERADAIRDAILDAFLAFGGIPEAFAVTADGTAAIRRMNVNPIQAWSAGALFDMLSA